MTAWLGFKGISPILLCLALLCLFIPVQAALVNGTFYQIISPDHPPSENATIFYFGNNTPQNDPKEWRVYPGDTIYLGGTYDLSYVMGISKQFAWWKDWKYQSTDCNPDLVNTVSYIDSRGAINPKMVYIDPEFYRTGNWWQWDGCFVDPSSSKVGEVHWLPYKNDNNLAFRIIYPPVWPKPTPTIEQVYIPPPPPIKTVITTPTINITPIETPAREPGIPWYMWIGGILVLLLLIGAALVM